jgi:hypothetical protein
MNKKQQQPTIFALTAAYLWLVMISLGANVFETFIIYPNIFHDVPHSLEVAKNFMVITGPNDFFRPIGFTALLIGSAALIFSYWRTKKLSLMLMLLMLSYRKWILASIIVIFLGEFLFSAAFFWPRNTLMFVEGTSVHSDAFLQKTAQEFVTGQWFRLAMNAVAAILTFVGLLKLYSHKTVSSLG